MIRIVRSTPIEQVKGGYALSESGAELWDIDMPETLQTPVSYTHLTLPTKA